MCTTTTTIRAPEVALWLTEADAMALLDLAVLAPCDYTTDQAAAVDRLVTVCKRLCSDPDAIEAAQRKRVNR
ncbi:MAG: hypothetical protein KGJ62_04940 [Armatimonadetes bacterium]|nr:hypothetical protein [Armatimonadota bacterium]MDE2205407.1 hypothetical protein [Armatimonadota bacterium]